uniref:Protein kinase domain-containing protein n=1 Tax=Kalanchoe fedtschenkoi TaxID=63787 RepID=A0A7N0U607_KALFE
MTVEEEVQAVLKKKKVVVVGVQIDSHGRELLNWAIVKVAEPGDSVVAVYVCRNSDAALKDKPLLDGLLGDYEDLCNIKQVNLSSRISLGRSIKEGIVKEAKAVHATVVIVGITVSGALGQGTSAARYCAKHLPLTTEVMAIHNGKVAYRSISRKQISGVIGDPQPSLNLSRNSDAAAPEIRSAGPFSNSLPLLCKGDLRETRSFSRRLKRVSLRSSSQCNGDPLEQIPGWPLLRTSSVTTPPKATLTRKISVVQWVMSLPDRSPPLTPQSGNESCSPPASNSGDQSDREKFSSQRSYLHKELGLLLDTSFSHLQLFNYEMMNNATSQFSSANLIGKGGSNHVYKGVLPDGKSVAVKVMMSSKEALKEFMQEVEIVSTLSHKNIVPLLGFWAEDSHLISVYDLLPKGSLEANLHDAKAHYSLTWEACYSPGRQVLQHSSLGYTRTTAVRFWPCNMGTREISLFHSSRRCGDIRIFGSGIFHVRESE